MAHCLSGVDMIKHEHGCPALIISNTPGYWIHWFFKRDYGGIWLRLVQNWPRPRWLQTHTSHWMWNVVQCGNGTVATAVAICLMGFSRHTHSHYKLHQTSTNVHTIRRPPTKKSDQVYTGPTVCILNPGVYPGPGNHKNQRMETNGNAAHFFSAAV